MATTTLKILREVNGYTQESIAEVLGISQNTYSRLERDPKSLNAEQAQKLSEFYNVSIGDLLSEVAPIITFQQITNSNNTNSANGGYFHSNVNQSVDSELVKALQAQNELLAKQNEELMELVRSIGKKLAAS
ncbi:MAG: helix-turn-helix transcriptional regulator [Chitinophagaceae bacterium]|nr:helix-turn-helix transcriptional regulator [Chitinophagaceae bacterium]